MNKYMVAYVSLFQNEIEMEQVTANDEAEAITKSKFGKGLDGMNMVAIKSYFFDCDSLIQVKKIEPTTNNARLYRRYILAKYRSFQQTIRSLTRDVYNIGLLHRPQTCEKCSNKLFLEMHHKDYTNPLDIEWLCKSCHTMSHCIIRDVKSILVDVGVPFLSYEEWWLQNKPKGDRPLIKDDIMKLVLKYQSKT